MHLRGGTVIENGDGAVSLAPSVVLVGESGARSHLEVALLTPEPPQDLAAFALYLVDGRGPFSGDEEVAVKVYVYGVDVEVVEGRAGVLWRLAEGLLDANMVQAAPLEEHLSCLEVELLGYPFPHRAVLRASDRGEVRLNRDVGCQERGVTR